ncbi:MAG: gliding motility-associated C-terminal domain-containing protein [Bacteroidales bacterium]|nr:gliding motility-associated C-terminal domain-containing protein [Bacteroidales bacterium]
MLKRVIAISVVVYIFCNSFSQDTITGIVNHYLKVLAVGTDEATYEDNAEISFFQDGDKVLLIQMTGVELDTTDGTGNRGEPARGTKISDKNTGRYEILQVEEVDLFNKKIIFTSDLMNTYDNGEKIQLVSVRECENNALISGTATAKDWDGNTGGILIMVVYDTLRFEGNIDVSDKGFRGATPETNYTGGCRPANDTVNFLTIETNRAGDKGEGNVSITFPYAKGCFFASSGGGGGNGLFSGGGGGSNFGDGGNGGRQDTSCSFVPPIAMGGLNANDLYSNNCITMGGGGGAGVQSTVTTASQGGDGGGIVIIAAGVITGNNYNIIADGENIEGTYNASGGGGGGGGTVLLDATTFAGALNISVKGGRGGSTGSSCTGSGGGGGGGVFWFSGQNKEYFVCDTSRGAPGGVSGCSTSGTYGLHGKTFPSLILPLNGFLFNVIRGKDTLCAGQQPKIITGSNPKGGDGNYTFKWEQSTDQLSWTNATGTGANQRDFTPAPLYNTTYFRRIVSAGGTTPQADTVSKVVEIYIYPAISNNEIFGTDTICYNHTALPVTGGQPAGGDGSNYTYQWQTSLNLTDWNDAGSLLTANQPYLPGQLTATRYFRRFITSTKYCADFSDTVTVTVLPSISNNFFKPITDTIICQGLTPGLLRAEQPINGDGYYTYLWQKKDNSGWEDITSSNIMEYTAGPLANNTQYRRIVFSGNDKACIDTSDIKNITVLEAIANNSISTDSSRYCHGDVPRMFNGSVPSGGDGPGSYTYKWIINEGAGWNEISDATDISHSHTALLQNSEFKRIVISGVYGACKDTTPPLQITVIPAIVNDLGLDAQSICENNAPLPFSPPAATGGNGSYTYQWLIRPESQVSWSDAPGVNNLHDYNSPALIDSAIFARRVVSDICADTSEPVEVYVFKKIKNNFIAENALKYACYNTPELLTGSVPVDGKHNDYKYLWQMANTADTWTDATGNTSNNLQNFETENLTTPKYFRRIVISSAQGAECIDTSNYVQVLINQLPAGSIIPSQDTTCEGGTVTLKYTVSGNHGPWNITFGDEAVIGSDITTSEGTDSAIFVFNTSQNVRILSVEDDSGCFADLTAASEMVNVKVYDFPEANAGDDAEICNTQYTLNATKSLPGTRGVWQSSLGEFNDPSLENATLTINPFISGKLNGWVKWTETNWRCADSDSAYLIFYEQPTEAEAGENKILDYVFQTTLEAGPLMFGSGKWSLSSGNAVFENDTIHNTFISGLDWDNVLKWTVTNGNCPSVSDSVNIFVNNLKLPNGFAPDNGSMNVFKVEIENAEKIELIVFNRLGQIVFEEPNYTEGNFWDGTNQNKTELPEGTYFYILKVKIAGKGEMPPYKSYIELLR